MADVSYPSGLRRAIQNTKNRGQIAGYRQSEAAGGPPYFEQFSDNVPTFWTFDLKFSRRDAAQFWSWMKSEAQNGRAWFNMQIATEFDSLFGIRSQEVHFTDSGFPRLVQETNDVLTYRCGVVSRSISTPVPESFIYQFFDLYSGDDRQASFLDLAINVEWPTE